jgi:hypothetical protein
MGQILQHAVITLNMLRTSIINPKLSAATHIFGHYISTEHQWHPREQES